MAGRFGIGDIDWADIGRSGTEVDESWRAKNLPVRAGGRHLALAVDEKGDHHLLVPKSVEELATNTRSPLAVYARNFRFSGGRKDTIEGLYLDIHCRVEVLNGQFDKVIADVVEAVGRAKDAAAAAAAAVAAWRRLFATLAESRALTYQERLAAFGELSVLQELVENVKGFRPDWWTGPNRKPHDFELPGASIEVKSVGEDSTALTIHGLDQLALSDDKPLHLVIRQIVENSSGKTVAELLGEILSVAEGAPEIRDRAALLGVSDTDVDATRFTIQSTLIGSVNSDFPRIDRSDLREGAEPAVSSVRYDLDLAELRPYLKFSAVGDCQGVRNVE
ncbi:PD-(D/E)XK motif protein [Jongsikchunia kroppenstedtii]|uniref:PD-(D/E)XK motif protein n=1 Tax=Jongsikchunia kroppenstedtii TaxID=1121721 RepID=UPI0005BAACCB|nr:PD-(D/E)XK motif protein [Jongsikchunia kroppenstedtii]